MRFFRNKTKDCYNCKTVLSAIRTAEKNLSKQQTEIKTAKETAYAQLPDKTLPTPAIYSSSEQKYGTVVCSKSDIRQLIYHAPDKESVLLSMNMDKYLADLRYTGTEVPKHFTEKKQNRGLVEYTVYELTVGKDTFVVKCEARDKNSNGLICEHPYSMYKK